MCRASILLAVSWLWVATSVSPVLTSVCRAQHITLDDATSGSGLDFAHFSGRTGKHFIIETVTCGLATFDYDGDGLIDVYLPNGAALQGAALNPAPRNRLFKNLGNMQFRDVTESSGAGDLGFALGVVVGDYDNDGDPDVVVANFGANVLLENQSDGTFVRREFAAEQKTPRISAGAALLDADSDGDLEVYISRYVDFTFDKEVNRKIFGVPAAPGPKDYEPDSDLLYANTGDGQLVDVSVESGVASVKGAGMGVIAFDYDEDGDSDVFVCNDSAANFLFENQGNGTFLESGLLTGLAYDVKGARQASMGVDGADVDHDGHIDLVTTNFVDEIPTLYLNSGLGYFDDIGAAVGLGKADRSVTWGVGLVDLDNDGWEDCFICAGHLIDGVARVNDSEKFEAPHVVLRNEQGRFSAESVGGSAFESVKVSRGAAFDDLDNDGDLDAIVLNLNSAPQLIRNALDDKNHFLQLSLVGTQSNRDAIGARVELTVGGETLVREVSAGRGYQSHYGSRLQFGLGDNRMIESLKVHWPSGTVQAVEVSDVDRLLLLVEGEKGVWLD